MTSSRDLVPHRRSGTASATAKSCNSTTSCLPNQSLTRPTDHRNSSNPQDTCSHKLDSSSLVPTRLSFVRPAELGRYTFVRFFITIRLCHKSSQLIPCRNFQQIRTVFMPTVRIDVPNGDAYQRFRRRLYAERNKATLERMNQREAQYRQLREAQEEAQRTAINVVDPEEARHLNHQQDKHAQEAGSRHEQGRKRKR
ncbi:hypothetical protein PSHT_14350 [Puccinia striiformis]|uniref:Uncharacterized protein n=2 Tax=Puccinia striiformis TaxID=27350 RepID=A0A2S4UKQ2_9BASI|nr:hypothetical protein PSHT_14350 [Puccinia striiformis]POW04778.1 hypothetical protein PSTT_10166 [Puccinia striiformis]